jgi:hypothetical protein
MTPFHQQSLSPSVTTLESHFMGHYIYISNLLIRYDALVDLIGEEVLKEKLVEE